MSGYDVALQSATGHPYDVELGALGIVQVAGGGIPWSVPRQTSLPRRITSDELTLALLGAL